MKSACLQLEIETKETRNNMSINFSSIDKEMKVDPSSRQIPIVEIPCNSA